MKKLKHLDLFSGIAGFALGLKWAGGFETVGFCEIDKYCQKVLKKNFPGIPIYDDVCEITNGRLEADGITGIDIITGGFPCQDLSIAGKQAGIEAERSGLWSELYRIIGEIRPSYAIVENVSNLLSGPSEKRGGWFGTVLRDLASIGYDAEWNCISPSAARIPSNRDRVWIFAYPAEKHVEEMVAKRKLSLEFGGMGSANFSRTCWTMDKCRMGRGIDGVPDEVYRFEGLGNAVVPQIPEIIGRAIMAVEGMG